MAMLNRVLFVDGEIATNSIPLLKRIAVVKISTLLWNNNDVTSLMNKIRTLTQLKQNWKEIENTVEELVPKLTLPEKMKREILYLVQPMGRHIYNWVFSHMCKFNVPKNLSWTQQGTIDRKKTAAAIVNNCSISVGLRYVIACVYCFESDARELWDEMLKKYMIEYPGRICKAFRLNSNWKQLVNYWNDVITDNNCITECRIENAFIHAVYEENLSAIKFLFQKLTHDKRDVLLKYAVQSYLRRLTDLHCSMGKPQLICENYGKCPNPFVNYTLESLLYLLSHLGEVDGLAVLEKNAFGVLIAFFDWPCKDLFLQMANRLWRFLDDRGCQMFLAHIVKMMQRYKDYNYHELFTEIWEQCLHSHKRYIIKECASCPLLFHLYVAGSLQNIRLIMKDATLKEQEAIIVGSKNFPVMPDGYYDDDDSFSELFRKDDLRNMWLEFLILLGDLVVDEEQKDSYKRLRTG